VGPRRAGVALAQLANKRRPGGILPLSGEAGGGLPLKQN